MNITQEKEPHYIKTLKEDLINHFDRKIEETIDDFAITVATQFREIEKDISEIKGEIVEIKDEMKDMVRKDDISDMVTKYDIRDMATKEDIKPILQLIGSYEVLAFNNQEILLKDHKPRIVDLEKVVFA